MSSNTNKPSLADLLKEQMQSEPVDLTSRKVTAIKRLRTATSSLGLKEAKDIVELIQHANAVNIVDTCKKLQQLLKDVDFSLHHEAKEMIEALVTKRWAEWRVVDVVCKVFPDCQYQQIVDYTRFAIDQQKEPF